MTTATAAKCWLCRSTNLREGHAVDNVLMDGSETLIPLYQCRDCGSNTAAPHQTDRLLDNCHDR